MARRPPDEPRRQRPRPARSPGVRFGADRARSPTAEDRSASCGGRRLQGSTRSTRARRHGADLRPGQPVHSAPGVLRGLHCHRRQLDHWVVVSGRAFVALVDVRPMLDGSSRVARRSRRASSPPTTGSSSRPGSPTGSSPSNRWSSLYLVTNEYDGTDELGFAWDDPTAAVPVAARPGDDRRPARSCPSATDRTRRSADLVVRLRDTACPDRTPPHHPGPHPTVSDGATGQRDHPAIDGTRTPGEAEGIPSPARSTGVLVAQVRRRPRLRHRSPRSGAFAPAVSRGRRRARRS